MSTPLKSQSIFSSDTSLCASSIHGQAVNHSVIDADGSMAIAPTHPILIQGRYSPMISPPPVPSIPISTAALSGASCTIERLNLSRLANFEVVTDQYQQQGVQFRNSIALHPSNPAFPPYSGQAIVLGGPKNGTMDLVFSPPVRTVESHVTSSATTILTAFGPDNQVLDQDETLGRNLADEQSDYEPNAKLSVQSSPKTAIHRIRLRCGGGQLALTDLSFSRISD